MRLLGYNTKKEKICEKFSSDSLHRLIGLTCFVTTDVYASSDTDARMSEVPLMTFVYGYAYVGYSYTFPVVSSSHGAYIANDSGNHPDWPRKVPVRYYIDFESTLIGDFPRWFNPSQDWGEKGWVAGWDTYGVGRSFSFDLSEIVWQEITIQAESGFTVKVDHDGDGVWDASDFWGHQLMRHFPTRTSLSV
ncbi:MAG: hypothetical protein OXI67_15020 [Candidatus Poribacteria bacterium]|nr:hypothetical protein [Candidatus Poribacteria bacterium]